jgi:type IV pilus assembly protein PilC
VSLEVLLAFTQQLGSFVEAGIPMVESLDIALEETNDPTMKATILDIRSSVERGSSFADAVARHTRVFPAFYRAMLRSADYTGNLNEVLAQAGVYLERDISARKQVKSALTYPIVVVCVAVIAIVLMAAFVLPKFASLYKSVNARLPLPTRILLNFTEFFNNYWWALFLGVAGAGLLVMAVLGGTTNKRRRDTLFWNLPGFGNLVRTVAIERFCRVLAALTRAGVPLPESLEVAADSTNSTVFVDRVAGVREAIMRGSGLSESIKKTGVFPNTAQQMIDVGERTGALSSQLGRAATFYERDVTQRIKRLTDLFEPLVIMFIGLVVGFVAIAQVSAMYSIFNQIK